MAKGIQTNTGRTHFKKGCIPWNKGEICPRFHPNKSTKFCFKCKTEKPLLDFFKDKSRWDNLTAYCKKCHTLTTLTSRKKNITRYNAYARKYSYTEKCQKRDKKHRKTKQGKEVRKKAKINWRKNHPEKYKAQSIISNAIQGSKLPKPSTLKCLHCDNQAQEYHHHKGYAKEHWLDVIPLCKMCHNFIHRS